jgi:hypothetical protein
VIALSICNEPNQISLGRCNAHSTSELGLVTRVTPVHTALRNCMRDEGRSFEVGNQVLISSHRKLLCSKGTVVNVAGKGGTRFRQARLREANVSEPSMKCRNRIRRCQNRGLTHLPG